MKTKSIIISSMIFIIAGCSDVQNMFSGSSNGGLPQWGANGAQQGNVIYAQSGETLAQAAMRHGIDPQSVAVANNMSMDMVMNANQALRVPASHGAMLASNVQQAPQQGPQAQDTWQTNPYGTPQQPAGQLDDDLPTARDPNPSPQQTWNTASGAVSPKPPTSTNVVSKPVESKPVTSTPTPTPVTQPTTSTAKGGYDWPVQGQVVKGYSASDPAVIIAAPPATPVRAAKSGKVIHAGTLTKYGKAVLVEHDDGLISIYGYNDSLLVNKGDMVSKGQTISRVGNTGVATAPSLRFEILEKSKNKAVNPNDYLQ